MADFSGMDVSGILNAGDATLAKKIASSQNKLELDMTDFITLMITELTNQGIDDSVDTSDMLNQMVQMQMVQAMVNMTDASIMSYSSSLVGKEVTVVDGYDSNGKPIELVGRVMGTGQYNGEQVIFLDNDKYYKLSEIMAVGRLPADAETGDPDDKVEIGGGSTEKPGDTDNVEKPGEGGDAEKPGDTDNVENPGDTDAADGTDGTKTPDEAEKTDGVDQARGANAEYDGTNGAPEDTNT